MANDSGKKFYVYELWNPISNSIFYVGKGTINYKKYRRLQEHIKDTNLYKLNKRSKTHKYTTISKILDSGMEPIIKIVFETDDQNLAFEKEIELIRQYGRRDLGTGILTNHTNGGEGMSGWKHTSAHKEKLRKHNPGGISVSRPIVKIDSNTGEILKEYASSCEAGKTLYGVITTKEGRLLGKNRGNIHACATKSKHRKTKGFYWRFKDDPDIADGFLDVSILNKSKPSTYRKNTTVIQIDTNSNNIVKEWNSAKSASIFFNKSASFISECAREQKTWNGYLWAYKSDYLFIS